MSSEKEKNDGCSMIIIILCILFGIFLFIDIFFWHASETMNTIGIIIVFSVALWLISAFTGNGQ